MRLETVKARIISYNPQADLGLIDAAFAFSSQAHQGQFRISGEEFIEHPLAVASILAELELDVPTVAAGLLHDVVEDTGVTLAEMETKFGKEIVLLVDGVTKLGKLGYRSPEERQVENLRKMFLAMAKDIRVILIKLADRLHNMRTLRHRSTEKQREIAKETLEIFAPLAHRLGIFRIKWELEDLSLRYLEPEKYKEIVDKVAKKRNEREEYTEIVMKAIREKLEEVGVLSDVSGRPKHFYSIYKKMYGQGRDFSDIYDLIAVRVLVETVKDCYGALGIIHTLWKPLPGRFKDYIATPKPNLYQSLHTTVIGPQGEPFEIQIRTWDMHRTAEFGVAAHWRYKEGKTDKDFDKKLSWLRGLLEWHSELRDAQEFVESIKVDIFADQVFVFTPKGHVIDLPAEATPLDFAYAIHSDVGHRCVGAKVNGRIVPLDSKLHNGDIIEILTSKQSTGPSADWLKIVKTSSAKSKIKQFFKRERRDENLARGRELLDREIRRQGLDAKDLQRPEWMEEVRKRFNVPTDEDLLVSIGFGGITAPQVVNRLKEEWAKERKALDITQVTELVKEAREWEGYGKPSQGIRVKGVDNVLVRFSRCCNPVPGDPVIGYITRGRGVAVHRLDCPNMVQFAKDPDRLIEVAWEAGYAAPHPVEIQVKALDRSGLLADVANAVAETRVNVLSAMARTAKDRTATIDMVLEIRDLDQLQYIIQRIHKLRDIMNVERVVRQKAK